MTRVLALLLAAAAVAACGAEPTATTPRRRPPPAPVAPSAAPASAAPATDAAAIMAQVAAARRGTAGFSATAETWETSDQGGGRQTLRLAWKAPKALRIDVVEGSAATRGATLRWDGGTEARLKAPFLPFAVARAITDPALVSWNGWTLAQTSPQGILDDLLAPGASHRLVGTVDQAGRPTHRLEVVSPKRPAGATDEIFGIDAASGLPTYREIRKAGQPAYRLTLKGVKLGAPAASAL